MNLNRLKEIREDKDLSQNQISKILKISRTYYTNLENNIKIITLEKLNLYINYFDVSFDYALGLTNQRQYKEYIQENKVNYKYLGQNIKKLRNAHHVQQKDLARAINVSQVCISRYEQGLIKISTNNLCKIAEHFNASIDKLIRRPN